MVGGVLVMVLLLAASVVGTLWFVNGRPGPDALAPNQSASAVTPTAPAPVVVATSSSPTGLAACIIGIWREKSNVTTVTMNGKKFTTTMTNGIQEYRYDGVLVFIYANAAKETTAGPDGTTETRLDGTISYRYSLSGNNATYTGGTAEGTYTVIGESGSRSLADRISTDQSFAIQETLSCSGNTLTQTGHRTDPNADIAWAVSLVRYR